MAINFPSSPADGDVYQDGTPRAWMYSSATASWIPTDISLGVGPHRIFTKDSASILSALTLSAGNNQSGYPATYGYGAALTLYGGQYTGALGYFQLQARSDSSTATTLTGTPGGALTWGGNAIWHAGNDGSGSGLDADTVDGVGAAASTYTPTLSNTTNVAASTAFVCQYLRVGNTVTVSGKVNIDPTAAGATLLGISLPIASAFTSDEELCGTAALSGGASQESGAIYADATNDRASLSFYAVTTSNSAWYFTFTYRVI